MVTDKPSALSEFKDFVLRGNVIDLAVAVVIGTFFSKVVTDVVNLILTLLAIPGTSAKSFSDLTFKIGNGTFRYGVLITDAISFLLVAAVVFFLVVRPTHILMDRRRRAPDPESLDRPCPDCLSEIPKAATRCRYCTTEVAAIPSPTLD